MHFHVFPYPAHRAGRQSAMCLGCWRELRKGLDRIQARARMQTRWIARGAHSVIGWSHKRGVAVVAAGDQQSRVDIGPVPAPEEVEVSVEDRPQAGPCPQPAIIEQEGLARGPVCANDALVAINRQQHADNAALRRRYRDDPLSTELLSKKSLFYGPRRSDRKG